MMKTHIKQFNYKYIIEYSEYITMIHSHQAI